jgi:hypothetical protein
VTDQANSVKSLISCNIVPGISDHCAVLLEEDWDIAGLEPQIRRLVPVYNKTDISGLQTFPREKFSTWAGNGTSVEEIWNNYKGIVFEGIKRFVPHKTLRSNPDPEYYNREVKHLKLKVRRAYNKRKSGELYQVELQRLSKQLLAAKKNAQETFLWSVLQNEGKCWTDIFKYVKRRKENRENTPALKDCNGRLISNPIEKANILNSYYASAFSCEQTFLQIQSAHSGELFTININVIRKRLAAIGRNKSIGPDGIPGDMLKLGGEAMIPYLA